jgi:hypothetical protein
VGDDEEEVIEGVVAILLFKSAVVWAGGDAA